MAGDAAHLPFADGSLRLVMAFQMLSQFQDMERVFVEAKRVLAPGGNRIAHIVLYGLSGPINVKGQDFNNTMLAWRETYTDEQIADVLTYIRSEWGNNAAPVDPQVVKAARAEARPNYESSDELLKMPVQ